MSEISALSIDKNTQENKTADTKNTNLSCTWAPKSESRARLDANTSSSRQRTVFLAIQLVTKRKSICLLIDGTSAIKTSIITHKLKLFVWSFLPAIKVMADQLYLQQKAQCHQ